MLFQSNSCVVAVSIEQHAVYISVQRHALATSIKNPKKNMETNDDMYLQQSRRIIQSSVISNQETRDLRRHGCGEEIVRKKKEKISQNFGFFFSFQKRSQLLIAGNKFTNIVMEFADILKALTNVADHERYLIREDTVICKFLLVNLTCYKCNQRKGILNGKKLG